MSQHNLTRFLEAQKNEYDTALGEIKRGKKTGHWMWYIFPQIRGLGLSETSKFFEIEDLEEARDYLDHPVLGTRLVQISAALLNLQTSDPIVVVGVVDSVKLKSSMTLFSLVEKADKVFQQVLDKFFKGMLDVRTMAIINK